MPPVYRETNENLEFLPDTHIIETLGIVWNPKFDAFRFKFTQLNETFSPKTVTKRHVLSNRAKIFDALGCQSPVSIKLERLMQRICLIKVKWRERLPTDLAESFVKWRSSLSEFTDIKLNRFVRKTKRTVLFDSHVFCDVSRTDYSGCNYVVAQDDQGGPGTVLLTAKAKVTPLKVHSIHCLQICAALLGPVPMKSVSKSLSQTNLQIKHQNAGTDAKVVMNWPAAETNCSSTFVANRVAKIQEKYTF